MPFDSAKMQAAAARLAANKKLLIEKRLAGQVKSATPTVSPMLAKLTEAKKAAAATATPKKTYKGKYIGPDKYKGVSQQGKKKFKGKYAGPDKYQGMNPKSFTPPPSSKKSGNMPAGYDEWAKKAAIAKSQGKSYVQGWMTK